MSNDDPFTLDLFGNTALSTGLGLGVTAFGSDFAANDTDDDPPP
ncbi:class I SAM-dependent methyltransferase, partial [Salmonella enterica subsp. enterica serovar Virchow]|nr:class I SAM-dependent methyltransferase [Salmonella enterica subsp. enterica serovar Virchow]